MAERDEELDMLSDDDDEDDIDWHTFQNRRDEDARKAKQLRLKAKRAWNDCLDRDDSAEKGPAPPKTKQYTFKKYLWEPDQWNSKVFKRRLRMTKPEFSLLLQHFIASPSYAAAGCQRSRRATPSVWLAACIRDLAAGCSLDLVCETVGIDESAYSSRRELLMQAVVDACKAAGVRTMQLPSTQEGWSKLADTFSRPEYPEFDNEVRVALAGDGSLIGFSSFKSEPYYDKEVWRCRKGYLATNCVMYFDGLRR